MAYLDAAPPSNTGYTQGDVYDFSNVRLSPTYTVTNRTNFNSTCNGLTAGETVVLTDGVYSGGPWQITNCHGTPDNPVVITCQSDWGASIEDIQANGFTITNCSNVIVGGFSFTRNSLDTSAGFRIFIQNSTYCRFTGCRLIDFDTTKTICATIETTADACSYNRWDHWLVTGTSTGDASNGIFRTQYDTTSGQTPDHTTYSYITMTGDYGHGKGIDIAPDSGAGVNVYDTIEYCHFYDRTNPLATNEWALIGIKSHYVTVQYNELTFSSRLNRGYAVDLRVGDYCVVRGNYIKLCTAIRVQGQYNIIDSNIIVDAGRGDTYWQYAIGTARWGNRATGNIPDTGYLTIANNSIIDYNRTPANGGYAFHIGYDNGPYTTGPYDVHDISIHNNLFTGVLGQCINEEYATDVNTSHNHFFLSGSLTVGDGGTDQSSGDPLLDAAYVPGSGSPALENGIYVASITHDVYGLLLDTYPNRGAAQTAPTEFGLNSIPPTNAHFNETAHRFDFATAKAYAIANSRYHFVSTIPQINTALASAVAGTYIEVDDHLFYDGSEISITTTAGTTTYPVVLAGSNAVGSTLNNRFNYSGRAFHFNGASNFVIGRVWVSGNNYEAIQLTDATNIRITECDFSVCRNDGDISSGIIEITNRSHFYKIDHCNFEGDNGTGYGIPIRHYIDSADVTAGATSQNGWIAYNRFEGKWGFQVIQIGQGTEWASGSDLLPSYNICEYNFFDGCSLANGSEIVVWKTSNCIHRYNYWTGCNGSMHQRQGEYNQIYGNYMYGGSRTNGSHISVNGGANHTVTDNVCVSVSGQSKRDGIDVLTTWGYRNNGDGSWSAVPEIYNIYVARNTLVGLNTNFNAACIYLYNDAAVHHTLYGSDAPDAAHDITIVDNILQTTGSNSGVVCFKIDTTTLPDGTNVYSNNIYYAGGSATVGNGYAYDDNPIVGDPVLDATYTPATSGLADGAAYTTGVGYYDVLGAPRPPTGMTIGAIELTEYTGTYRLPGAASADLSSESPSLGLGIPIPAQNLTLSKFAPISTVGAQRNPSALNAALSSSQPVIDQSTTEGISPANLITVITGAAPIVETSAPYLVRGFTVAQKAELSKDVCSIGHLIKLELDGGTLYFTDRQHAVDWGGNTYLANGEILEVADLEEALEMRSHNITLTFSGVGQTTLAELLANPYLQRAVTIYFAFFDTNYALIDDPIEKFTGFIDDWQANEDPSAGTSVIQVSIVSHWANFDRINGRRTNPESQAAAGFTTDTGFNYVTQIVKDLKWGKPS